MARTFSQGDRGPIRSSFSDDPDMLELVQEFVENLPGRVAQLKTAYDSNDRVSLTRLSHQLKGASGGYGFDGVGAAAGRVEASLLALPADSDVASLKRELNELVAMCQRVCV
ncbi:MAG: Hpt domain-containing protein [Planctomycetota bacterium]